MKCESCGAVLKEAKCDDCGTISTNYQAQIKVNGEPIIDAINNANQLQKKQTKPQEIIAPEKTEIEKQIRDQTQAKIKKEIEDRVASQIKKQEKPVISKSIKNDRIPIQFWRYSRFWGAIISLIIYVLYWIKLVNPQWSNFSRNWGISFFSFSMAYRPSVIILIVSFMMGTIFIKLLKIGKLSNPKGIVKNFPSVSPVQLEPFESNFDKNLEEIREDESPKVTPPPLPNIPMAPTPQPAIDLIDLNQASESDITTLPRINLILAKKIIQTREQLGGFINFEQFVQEVNLPENTAEAIKNQVTFSKIERKKLPTRGRMVDY